MERFFDGYTEPDTLDLHELTDDLINIVMLCQLLERTTELTEIRRYVGMLSDIAHNALWYGKNIRYLRSPGAEPELFKAP